MPASKFISPPVPGPGMAAGLFFSALNVFKTYILFTDSTDINIMSTDDQVISGGSVHFGTNNRRTITQTAAGQEHQYDLTGGGSCLISPLGGAIKLHRERKLHYLIEYNHDPNDQRRQRELEAIQADVRFSYGVYSEEVRMKSYTMALEMAIGNKQQGFALQSLHCVPMRVCHLFRPVSHTLIRIAILTQSTTQLQISWIRLPEHRFMRRSLVTMNINCSEMNFFSRLSVLHSSSRISRRICTASTVCTPVQSSAIMSLSTFEGSTYSPAS
jgi:hypothetical protein